MVASPVHSFASFSVIASRLCGAARWCPVLVWGFLSIAAVAYDAGADPIEITITDPLLAELGAMVPSAVSEIDAEYLREKGAQSTASVIAELPNVTWSGGTSRPRFLFVRGIGDLDQYVGSGLPAVTVMQDGLNLSGIANGLSLFDTRVARVERGPTGFFGGPSSLAGLVAFESARFDSSIGAEGERTLVEARLGTGGQRAIGARTIIGDQEFNGIITVERNHQDGFLRNAHLGRHDTNHRDSTIVRATTSYQSSQNDYFTISALSVQNDDGYDAFTIDNSRTTRSDRPGADDLGLAGTALEAAFLIDGSTQVELSSSFLRANSTYSYDGDWGNDQFWDPYVPYDFFSLTTRERDLLSGGAKLTFGAHERWKSQLGVYGQRLSESVDQQDLAEDTPYRTLQSDFGDTRLALHGSTSIALTSDFKLWLAGRRELQRVRLAADTGQPTLDDVTAGNLGQIGVQYFLSPSLAPYVKFSRGWRGGGYNVGAAVPLDRLEYAPEFLNEASTGVRWSFQDGQGYLDIAAFYGRRQSQQVRLELQTDPSDPLSFVYMTDNAARGTTRGAELSGQVVLSDRLSLGVNGALLDAEFSDFEGGRAELASRDAALAPNWRASASARYQFGANWFARVGVTSTDGYYFDDAHDDRAASVTLTDLSVGYESGSWSVVAWVHNVFDRRYPVRGFFFGNEPPDFAPKRYIQRGDPLNGGITVSYVF